MKWQKKASQQQNSSGAVPLWLLIVDIALSDFPIKLVGYMYIDDARCILLGAASNCEHGMDAALSSQSLAIVILPMVVTCLHLLQFAVAPAFNICGQDLQT